MKINKILIANRGEIACRIIQTCQKLGIKTVAIYAEIERNAKHVQMADEAFIIQAETPTAAYLDADAIIQIAKENHVDAIHPGYGFLSERAEFARKIAAANIVFIGAPSEALDLMGSKAAAKKTMIAAGVPCVPGFHGDKQDVDFLQARADEVGYPLLIKASAGGGGKGMRIVNKSAGFIEALNSAKREAIKNFGDDHVILERFITKPKHIEVQVFADSKGNVVHLFERDCSSQRRYQKIIEEAPATCINDNTKQAMYKAAIDATAAVDYQGAGTIEFIVQGEEFFFMEMNTRLQVEHRVTEMITGTDLVEWQIRVATGEPLPLKQDEIHCQGHAIQARIYAEDSFNGFLPATGLLEEVQFCTGDNIIIDTGIEKSNNISIHFDPMIAKTVCWAENREKCIEKVLHNLDNTFIVGVKTNLGFLSGLMSKPDFSHNTIFTNSLDNESLKVELPVIDNEIIATLIAKTSNNPALSAWSGNTGWSNSGNYSSHYKWTYNDEEVTVCAMIHENHVIINAQETDIDNKAVLFESTNQIQLISNHQRYIFDKINHQSIALSQNKGDIISPMPGKVLDIKVQVGDEVNLDQTLVVMEAMKMELSLKATAQATVSEILIQVNDVITADTLLIKFDS
ncbi:MAG: ATP-grasp domain-containing protein [Proteobacteria bacterium]|nr:ATP-grasp domain-containing protein [Pseudomonadota bacterium]